MKTLIPGSDLPAIEIRGLRKEFHHLRPLRIQQLSIHTAERVAILGLDALGAEVLVNVLTGTTLPDEGDVRISGRSTASIENSDEWLRFVDRFGIVSERTVLLEHLSLEQNIAVPLTLEIEPLTPAMAAAVRRLAVEVGLEGLDNEAASAAPEARLRVRLARAIALNPAILVLEHVTGGLPPRCASHLGGDIARLASRRGLSILALTADRHFATRVASRVVTLDAVSGALVALPTWRRWLGA